MAENVEQPSKRQAKKAQRDAERRKDRGQKRKHDATEENDLKKDFLPLDVGDGISERLQESAPAIANVSRKETKSAPREDSGDRPSKRKKKANSTSEGPESSKSRFIVFVGNLPYSTTDASLQIHFKKLEPFTLRHRVDPKTKKSKGFAFLEFENFDRMKTCLKLYHHSMFDPEAKESTVGEEGKEVVDEKSAAKKNKRARRINVELTAGGGGKNENRKEKIKAKNTRLEEQRHRRAELERKEKAKNDKKKGPAKGSAGRTAADADEDKGEELAMDSGIHPSRLARIQA